MELVFGLMGLIVGFIAAMLFKSSSEEINPIDLYEVKVPWNEKDPAFLAVKGGGTAIGTKFTNPEEAEKTLAPYIGYGIIYVRPSRGASLYYYSNDREMELRRAIYLKNKKD